MEELSKLYKCKICGVLSKTGQELLSHVKSAHAKEYQSNQTRGIDSIQTFGLMVRPSDL